MIYQDKTRDLVNQYTSLSLAINKLLERQEKNWGCFQVQKEGDFYSLYIPALPSFKLYQNTKSIIYRGYWRRNKELPKATDTKSFPPDLWIKKKQKKVAIKKNVVGKNSNTQKNKNEKPSLIDESVSFSKKIKISTSRDVIKKQRIYEIVYRYNPNVELRVVNQLIAEFLKEKITASIVSVPEDEIFPLVLVGNPE